MHTDDPFPFPLTVGVYDTSPKMSRLYTNNGHTCDGLSEFVYDSQRDKYLSLKLHALINKPDRYRVYVESDAQKYGQIAHDILSLFVEKCPAECTLNDRTIHFLRSDLKMELATGKLHPLPKKASDAARNIYRYLETIAMPIKLFDAFALHVQEDFAITARDLSRPFPNDYLELAHICFPSHWDPRQKIGKNFGDIHRPVANNERLLKAHHTLISSMFERGPFTRFVWGIAFSDDLDRHPEHIRESNEVTPQPKDDLLDRAFFRVERQVTYPLPALSRSFFTIRVFVKSLRVVAKNSEHCSLLREALLSMNDEALRYKGLSSLRDPLVDRLASTLV